MWRNEVIFSGGDLAQREQWIAFMREEYGCDGQLTDEIAIQAVEDRRKHIKSCIARLKDELEMLDDMLVDLLGEGDE